MEHLIFHKKIEIMKKRITFICNSVFILLFSCLNANSQNCEVLNQYVDSIYSKEEIHTLEKRICELLKKQKAVPDDNKINIYYIPDYDVPDYYIMPPDSIREYYLSGKPGVIVDREDFIAGNFLKRLSRSQATGRNKIKGTTYIKSEVIVTNSSDSLIAYGDARYLYITARYNKDSYGRVHFILKKMYELNMKQMFTLSIWMFPVFGITNKDEIVVFLYDKGYKMYTIKEFVDLYSKIKPYNRFSD